MDDANSEVLIAIRQQEKFQFYFLSLTFTLLALAIQTADLDRSTFERLLELGGWIAFAISGLAALRRLEVAPSLRHLWDFKTRSPHTPTEDQKRSLNEKIKRLEKVHENTYPIAKYGFLCGLLLVMASRAAAAVAAVADLFGYTLT